MNKIGVVAFGITTCVLVPTALHVLQAGPNQVVKLVAPDETSLRVGDARVDVSLDRAIIDPGGKVRVTLSATSENRTKVTLAVVVLESQGSGGGRVELPPDRLTRDEITLDVKDGKATKTVAYTLRGYRGQEMDGRDAFGHYTILVMPPKIAESFERLRRRADRVGDPMTDSTGEFGSFLDAYEGLGTPDSKLAGPGTVARLDVNTRATDSTVSILSADTAQAGDDLVVKVRVKNPTKLSISQVEVTLNAKPWQLVGEYKGIPEEQVKIDAPDDATIALAPHEAKDLVFHIHTQATGTLGLFATARCTGDDCYGNGSGRARGGDVDDSALDAIDILPAPTPDQPEPTVAAVPAPAAAAPAAPAAIPAAPAAPAAPAPAAPAPAVAKAQPEPKQ